MTREEQAIEYIKKYRELDEKLYNTAPKGTVSSIVTKKCLEFWDMAIQALSQEPCDDAEQIDYHDDFETASRKIHDYEERQKQNDKKCGSYNNTNTFKSCCDCKLIGTDSCYMSCGGSKSLYKPKQKSEPCTDAVSRQAVLDYLKVNVDDFPDYHEAIEKVLQMPSVTQKSGKWIYRREDKYSCSKCGTTTSVDESGIDEKPMYKFCPYCGAKMESEVNNG